ncbi:MAG: SIS domain-containing protein [Verrucomicrobia bacterium]|nr:SIS domain-containing protein [Verrucomicrobiota bacterium]
MHVNLAALITDARRVIGSVLDHQPAVRASGNALARALRTGRKLLTCGNGGSAADAMHLAEELVGRYKGNRRALAAVALNSDATALTCIANDFGYDAVFSRQVEALGQKGDVLVVFSTSGNSPSILNALAAAKKRGLVTVALLGKGGGKAKGRADHEIIIASDDSGRVQEAHTLVLHLWLELVETALA